jgi:AbiTii
MVSADASADLGWSVADRPAVNAPTNGSAQWAIMATVSLLDEIQASATNSAVPLSDMLRKCQILASRLRHEPFKQWVSHELNGYPDDAELPTYRGPFQGELKADTSGPFGSGVRNVGVPESSIPAEVRDSAREIAFCQGVGTLESMIADAQRVGETRVATMFSVDLAVLTSVVVNHQTVRMWKELPIAVVAGILDSVRSKALEFALQIEAENPDAGTTTTSELPVPLARTDAIFYTVIYGGQNAIGPGATVNVTQGATSVA